jgi:hypothetical protein
VNLGGTFGGISNGILRIAGVDINKRLKDAMDQAISADMLRRSLPAEVLRLNPSIQKAALFNNRGTLAASIEMTANVTGSNLTELLQLLIAGKKTD